MTNIRTTFIKIFLSLVLLATIFLSSLRGVNADDLTTTPVTYENINLNSGGGANNLVRIVNKVDSKTSIKGKIQLNKVNGSNLDAVNLAQSVASCNSCETYSVALQINLFKAGPGAVTPVNVAFAGNVACNYCITVARAVQFNLAVDDPMQVPDNVTALVKQLEDELRTIANGPSLPLSEVEARVESIINQFNQLPELVYQSQSRDVTVEQNTPGASL